ncbi:MAG: hypothetical protein EHM36_04365 [Deltaproteobacteria bacterium]|nr:MAG: hypothetical protein EHM36_04365 [Deltaproteobacteria bacterium]
MPRIFLYPIAFILAILLCCSAALPQDLVVFSMTTGECELRIESNEKWKTLRLRAHHPKYQGCHITKDEMVSVLDRAFSKTDPPRLEGVYSSLSIGRLIDYPWLSQYLATTAYRDRGWDSKKGKPVTMDINKYVSQLLLRKKVMAQIETVFEKGGYRVVGVTAEKVLVGGFREVPFYRGEMQPGRVPYDAQVWFRLERN